MKKSTILPEGRTISFVDEEGRTITMPAPKSMPSPAPPPVTRTVADTNISHRFVDKDGVARETAIKLRDDSVQEIFERVPALLTRFGSTIVLGVLLFILVVMAFIQFPNSISTTTTVQVVPADINSDVPRVEAAIERSQRTSEALIVPLPSGPLLLNDVHLPYQEFLLAYETYREEGERQHMVAAVQKLEQLEMALSEWRSRQPSPTAAVGDHYATLDLPVAATTNLELGQPVLLELDKYNADRYGRLEGKVNFVRPASVKEGSYRVFVELPMGLETSKGKKIDFEIGLSGTAVLITDRSSLLMRILRR